MGIFAKQNKTGGFADVIRCDQPDYLIWKWHPSGAAQGTLKRETAIRTNSVLRVKEGEVAVFVYKQKDGANQDFIVGPKYPDGYVFVTMGAGDNWKAGKLLLEKLKNLGCEVKL